MQVNESPVAVPGKAPAQAMATSSLPSPPSPSSRVSRTPSASSAISTASSMASLALCYAVHPADLDRAGAGPSVDVDDDVDSRLVFCNASDDEDYEESNETHTGTQELESRGVRVRSACARLMELRRLAMPDSGETAPDPNHPSVDDAATERDETRSTARECPGTPVAEKPPQGAPGIRPVLPPSPTFSAASPGLSSAADSSLFPLPPLSLPLSLMSASSLPASQSATAAGPSKSTDAATSSETATRPIPSIARFSAAPPRTSLPRPQAFRPDNMSTNATCQSSTAPGAPTRGVITRQRALSNHRPSKGARAMSLLSAPSVSHDIRQPATADDPKPPCSNHNRSKSQGFSNLSLSGFFDGDRLEKTPPTLSRPRVRYASEASTHRGGSRVGHYGAQEDTSVSKAWHPGMLEPESPRLTPTHAETNDGWSGSSSGFPLRATSDMSGLFGPPSHGLGTSAANLSIYGSAAETSFGLRSTSALDRCLSGNVYCGDELCKCEEPRSGTITQVMRSRTRWALPSSRGQRASESTLGAYGAASHMSSHSVLNGRASRGLRRRCESRWDDAQPALATDRGAASKSSGFFDMASEGGGSRRIGIDVRRPIDSDLFGASRGPGASALERSKSRKSFGIGRFKRKGKAQVVVAGGECDVSIPAKAEPSSRVGGGILNRR